MRKIRQGKIGRAKTNISSGQNLLHRLTIGQDNDRTQNLVTLYNLGESTLQRLSLQWTLHMQGNRDVVERAFWLQLTEEPQAPLGKREREQSPARANIGKS